MAADTEATEDAEGIEDGEDTVVTEEGEDGEDTAAMAMEVIRIDHALLS